MKKTRILLAAVVAALTVAIAAGAAALPKISVSAAGFHGTSSAKCGKDVDSSAVAGRGSRVVVSGTVSPTPRSPWHAVVYVKRCVAGKFQTSWTRTVTGRSNGSFSATYLAGTSGVFIAKASYGVKPRVDSKNVHFIVK